MKTSRLGMIGLAMLLALSEVSRADWFITRTDLAGKIRHYTDSGAYIEDLTVPNATDSCRGITMDASGHLYTCSGSTTVWKYDWNKWTQWTTGATHFTYTGRGLAFETNGCLHVADGDRIQKFDPSGAWVQSYLFGASQIRGVCLGLDGMLYAADVSKRIYRFSGSAWALIITATNDVCYATADAAGNVYASAPSDNKMMRFAYDSGTQTYSNDVNIGFVLGPLGVAWGTDGGLYAASAYDDGLRKWNGVSTWPQAFPLTGSTWPEGIYQSFPLPKGVVFSFK